MNAVVRKLQAEMQRRVRDEDCEVIDLTRLAIEIASLMAAEPEVNVRARLANIIYALLDNGCHVANLSWRLHSLKSALAHIDMLLEDKS